MRTIRLADRPVGEFPSPFEINGIVITIGEAAKKEKQTVRFIEQHRLKGVELGAYTELRLHESADQVDLLIAHFGKPPKVTAFKGDERLAMVELSDLPRQLELAHLLGDGIDRVVVEAGGEALLAEVRYWIKQETGNRKRTHHRRHRHG